jgi:hypothetical protein
MNYNPKTEKKPEVLRVPEASVEELDGLFANCLKTDRDEKGRKEPVLNDNWLEGISELSCKPARQEREKHQQ